ncbi:MAG: site-specific integrase [Rhodoferax sp.]|nr:site-specific integrase [Rhodoferax sp.]
MASFSKRIFKSWRVSVALQGDLNKAFDALEQAQAYAQQLNAASQPNAQVRPYQSTGWQARIRSKLAPQLTRTFPTKALAEEWAKAREGEIVKRQFIDYREADRFTFGDLLRRYEAEHLSHLGMHDPDRARIAKMCRHPITLIRMSALQASDFARYRDQRLKGGFTEPNEGSNAPRVWAPVKGTSVKRELAIMSNVISIARKEWNVHMAINPASGVHTARPAAEPGDERDRRLAGDFQGGEEHRIKVLKTAPSRDRRQSLDAAFELNPETAALLKMPQTEQQALLRACRYPEWFRPRKKDVTANTLLARAKKSARPAVKARLRLGGGMWALFSLSIETALRRGEMVKLEWTHLHLDHGNGYLMLPASITKNKKQRMVPLTLRARRIMMSRPKISTFIFATNENTIKMAFSRAKKRAHITDLRVHDLRHEGTSRLFEQTTLRAEEIGSITGQTDPRMLRRYYNMRPEEFVDRFAKSRK